MIALALLAAAAPVAADPVDAAIATMSVERKAAQLQSTAPADRDAGLPAYDWWNEGLHGLARNGYATVFPQAIALGATWDAPLMEQVGTVISTEARARFNALPADADRRIYQGLTIWSPNINIFRDPRWGRGQETYGEDPFLTGTLAVGFIRGLQGPDLAHPRVIATPKHLAVHSGPEGGRDSFDVDPSPQDMEATYLPAFRMAVTQGHALSLMCSYNAIRGVPACADGALLNGVVRKDWGFTGYIVSDCDAVGNIFAYHHYSIDRAGAAAAALRGGTDVNCGSTYAALPDAVTRGLVSESEVDVALHRALEARRKLGAGFGAASPWSRIAPGDVDTPQHRALALRAARESIVLLKNDAQLLPLKPGMRLAVVGADADDLGVLEANYHGTASAPVTPLEGIRARFGRDHVFYAQGSPLAHGVPVIVPETALSFGGRPGLRGEYFAGPRVAGRPVAVRQDRRIDFDYDRAAPLAMLKPGDFAVRWTGRLTLPGPGAYRLALDIPACWKDCTRHDAVRLWIDGKLLHDGPLGGPRVSFDLADKGQGAHTIRLELDHGSEDEGLRLLWSPPEQALRRKAVAVASRADAVIAVLGLSPDLEGEALQVHTPGFSDGDRTGIELPPPQRALLDALAKTGKPIIVVLTSGSALALDPKQADAILAAWYPGEAGGTAIAETLAGDNNPSGKLPVTFYRSTGDLPAFTDYGMKERTYRYFTGEPLWGFGHGLSYTSFSFSQPGVTAGSTADPVELRLRLSNSGRREGEEVVQAYVIPPQADDPDRLWNAPVLQRQLAAFTRVALKPRQESEVHLTIDRRSISTVFADGTRRVLPGTYRVWIGGGQPGDGPGLWQSFTLTGAPVTLPK